MGRESTKNEGVRSAAAREAAPSIDGPAGRAPKFSRRSSQVVVGLTIGAKREKLETKNERAAARKKDKQKYYTRVALVSVGFIGLVAILIALASLFLQQGTKPSSESVGSAPAVIAEPTIEIIDASAPATGGKITSRMRHYIGLIEADLKSYDYHPVKAVVPTETIREVDIYLDGFTGYFKTNIDRDAAVAAEDIDRMIRYLAGQGIADFEYVDVRIDGRAFWK